MNPGLLRPGSVALGKSVLSILASQRGLGKMSPVEALSSDIGNSVRRSSLCPQSALLFN